jgi:hypothetical protein
MKTVDELFEAWPEPRVANFARDLGVTTEHAAQMKRRKSVPVQYWSDIVRASAERGISGVNFEVLVEIHSSRAA